MGLNPRGRGRGRGGKVNFPNKGPRGGRMGGQGPMFRGGPPGMFCPPPMGFPPEPPFNGGGGSFFPGPSGFNFGPPRPGFGKYPRKNFKRRIQQKNETPAPEIDLTKPWVTDEIKVEDGKKQEYLETWRKSKNDEDWSKYKLQKEVVKNLYEKAKEEYLASHQEEANYWRNLLVTQSNSKRYFCETCDKAFRTEDDMIWHEEEHETCGREGCQFTAHPKVIAKHVKMQHHSGLFKRIGKLYTEEEIAKWIEERKRKYPSRRVIEEKKALEAEKLKRGERIKVDNAAFNKSLQKKCKNKCKYQKEKYRKNRRVKKKNRVKTVRIALEEEIMANTRSVPAFSGIGRGSDSCEIKEEKISKDKDLDISDEEWECPETPLSPIQPLINKSLGLLASAYRSDDDDDETERKEAEKENRLERIVSEISQGGEDNEPPEEVKTVKVKAEDSGRTSFVDSNILEQENWKRKKTMKRNDLRKKVKSQGDVVKNDFESRNLTLLEKLLKDEIKHERNVILQCVHYVVKNNFFEIT